MMNRKKSLFLLITLLFGLFMNVMTTFQTVIAFADTGGRNILTIKPEADNLPKDKNGQSTILDDVTMVAGTEDNPLFVGETFILDYEFTLPKGLTPKLASGDYFEFSTPNNALVGLAESGTGDLVDNASRQTLGTFEYTEGTGQVKVIFNSNISTYTGAEGTISLLMKVKSDSGYLTGQHDLEIPNVISGKEVQHIYVTNQLPLFQTEKLDVENSTDGYRYLQTKMIINPGNKSITQGEIKQSIEADDLKGGVSRYSLDRVMTADVTIDGNINEKEQTTDVTMTEDGVIKLPEGSHETYVVYVKAKLIFGSHGKFKYVSTMTSTNQETIESGLDYNLTAIKMVANKSLGLDKGTQEITWEVTYNPNSRFIPKEEAMFYDSVLSQKHVKDSYQFVSGPKGTVTYPSDSKMEVSFNQNVTGPVVMTYKTIYTGGSSKTVSNTVTGNLDTAFATQDVTPTVTNTKSTIRKSSGSQQAGKLLSWSMEFNSEAVKFDRWEIHDEVDDGEILLDTIKIVYGKNWYNTLSPNDYEVEPIEKDGIVRGFDIKYDKPGSSAYKITYKSSFVGAKKNPITNNVTYGYDIGDEHFSQKDSSRGNYTAAGKPIAIAKEGVFLTEDNEIQWDVFINTNLDRFSANALMTDPIPENMEIVENSIKYDYRYLKDSDWSEVFQTPGRTEAYYNEETNTVESRNVDYDGYNYRVRYRTRMKPGYPMPSKENPVVNKAYFSDDDTPLTEAIATVDSVDLMSLFVRKEGQLDVTNNNIDWQVTLNPKHVAMEGDNIKLIDSEWENLVVNRQSIRLVATDENELTRTLISGQDYELTYTERAFYITFLHDVGTDRIDVTYRSQPRYPKGSLGQDIVASNQVTLENVKGLDEEATPVIAKKTMKVPSSSGEIEGLTSDIVITKLDKDDKETPLSGAEFVLYRGMKIDDDKIIDFSKTGEDGQTAFTKLINGDYLLVERQAPEGYFVDPVYQKGQVITVGASTTNATQSEEAVIPVTVYNAHYESFKTNIPVSVQWQGVPKGETPPNLTIELYGDGKKIAEQVVQDSEQAISFDDLSLYDKQGELIDYEVTLVEQEHVTGTVTKKDEPLSFEITAVLEITDDVSGVIKWDDNQNTFNHRPEEVSLNLYQNGQEYGHQVVVNNGQDEWAYTFSALPQYDLSGNPYEYTVSQNNVIPFTTTVSGYDILNYYRNLETFDPIIQVTWNDYGNKFELRPTSEELTVELHQNNQVYPNTGRIINTDKDNEWTYQYKDVPVYDEEGTPYSYNVTQGKLTAYEDPGIDGFKILNTYINKEKVSVTMRKEWDDYSNKFNTRPNNVTLNLFQNGTELVDKKQELSASDTVDDSESIWERTVGDLPKYDEVGEFYDYTVDELRVPTGYTLTKNGNTMLNQYRNTDKIELQGRIDWDDYQDKFHTRPDSVLIELYDGDNKLKDQRVSSETTWNYAFKNLDKYNGEGEEITYVVKQVLDTATVYKTKAMGLNFLNTYQNEETVDVNIEKVWEGQDIIAGLRPDDLAVSIYENNNFVKEVTLQPGDNVDTWSMTEKLKKYDEYGEPYEYTAEEESVPGYEQSQEVVDDVIRFTNSYENKETTTITGNINWDDYNNQFGLRPAEVTLTLQRSDASTGAMDLSFNEVKKVSVTGNVTQYQFEDVKLIDEANNQPYQYKATLSDLPDSYTQEQVGYDFMAQYVSQAKTTVDGTVVWDDYSNRFGTRPTKLTFHVLQESANHPSSSLVDLGTETIDVPSGKDEFTFSITEMGGDSLARYDENGNEYAYRLVEDSVGDYQTGHGDYILGNAAADTDTIDTIRITNTYRNQETIDLTTQKIWDDYNGRFEGIRPKEVRFSLYQDNEVYQETPYDQGLLLTGDANDSVWAGTFSDLKKYNDATGEPYQYEVKELQLPKYDQPVVEDMTITNRYRNNAQVTIDGKVVWDDYDNQFNTRPETLMFELLGNDASLSPKALIELTVTNEDEQTFSFGSLPAYDEQGEEIWYTVNQIMPNETPYVPTIDYDIEQDDEGEGPAESIVAIINNEYKNTETQTFMIEKIWDDYNNRLKTRPDSIYFDLMREKEDGTEKERIQQDIEVTPQNALTSTNQWQKEITGTSLFIYDELGKPYHYYFEEKTPVSSEYDYQLVDSNDTQFTNQYRNEETVDIGVKIDWDDEDNKLQTRPESVFVELKQNGISKERKEVSTNKRGIYELSFDGLPVYDSTGEAYAYTIEEQEITGYHQTNKEETSQPNTEFVIHNQYINDEQVTVNGEKVWVDQNNMLAKRPTTITLELYQLNHGDLTHEVLVGTQTVMAPKSIGEEDVSVWPYEFKNLPKYSESLDEYTYQVKEKTVTNYETSIEGHTVQNTYTYPEIRQVKGSIIWDDYDNSHKTRPETVSIELRRDNEVIETKTVQNNDSNRWEYTFDNLKDYDASGEHYVYTVREVETGSLDVYDTRYDDYDIINTYRNKEVVDMKGIIEWDDYNNELNSRPDNLNIYLLQNGKVKNEQYISAETGWRYSFTELPKYDATGKLYEYAVKEEEVPGYDQPIYEPGKIINRFRDDTQVTFTGSKIWDDYDNKFNTRPNTVSMVLYQTSEGVTKELVTQEVTFVNSIEDKVWPFEFTNLPKYNELGHEFTYRVEEKDVPLLYTSYHEADPTDPNNPLSLADEEAHRITNVYRNTEKLDVSGTIYWNDYENKFGTRPSELRIGLMRNGDWIESQVTSEEKGWHYTFENLMKYDENGDEFDYFIGQERILNGKYENTSVGYDLINTYENKEVVTLDLVKEWQDHQNVAAFRPTSITIHVLQNGIFLKDVTLSGEGDTWSESLEGLKKYDADGDVYRYTAEEEMVPGYEQASEVITINEDEQRIIFTNSYSDKETISIEGKINWEDYSNQFKTRPEKITLVLSNETGVVDEIVVDDMQSDGPDTWSYAFDNLKKINDETATPYHYVVTEKTAPENGYTSESYGYDFYHSYVSQAKVAIIGTKDWDDYKNKFETRPEEVTFNLLRNNELVDQQTVSVNEDLEELTKFGFEDLDRYDPDGKAYNYTILESVVGDYTVSYEWERGTSLPNTNQEDHVLVTNTYINTETIMLRGTKMWDDYENKFGTRPASIQVTLEQNGTVLGQPVEVRGNQLIDPNEWSYGFGEQFVYDKDGEPFIYTVSEQPVLAYESQLSENGMDLTNTYRNTEEVTISGNKIWDDYKDKFETRPEAINIGLMQNKMLYKEVTLTGLGQEDLDRWAFTFENNPKYDAYGVEYEYEIKELSYVEGYDEPVVNGFDVTNTYKNRSTKDVVVSASWIDEQNKLKTRPKELEFTLEQNGQVLPDIGPIILNEENDYTVTVTELPMYDNDGELYEYEASIKTEVPNYNQAPSKGLEFVFTYLNEKTIKLNGHISWEDDTNKAGLRPNQVSLSVYRESQGVKSLIETVAVSESSDWKYEVTGLKTYDDELNEYVYTVIQESVKGYETRYEGYNITNRLLDKVEGGKPEGKPTDKPTDKPVSKLPQTGERQVLPLMIAGFLLIGNVAYVNGKRRRK